MRKAAETPCKQRALRDPPRTAAGPLPKQHACNTSRPGNNKPGKAPPNTRQAKGLGSLATAPLAQGCPVPPSTLSARPRAGAPAPAEALPARLRGRRSDESEPGYGRTPFAIQRNGAANTPSAISAARTATR